MNGVFIAEVELVHIFFFNQKTAYEMRSSDWSSDVCSSDLSDKIDRHTWQLLKGVALSTLLGVGTELGWGDGESDLVRAIRESTQQNGTRAGDQFVTRNLDIQQIGRASCRERVCQYV